jgi:ATPase subunit of ABC transporter with duplicated ATPase domains
MGESEADDSSLCDISFSLAFGGKILLHNTHLKLGKGRRYGLMGKNGAGKTTLLTNIGSGIYFCVYMYLYVCLFMNIYSIHTYIFGLMGKNGAGKTTLLTNIGSGMYVYVCMCMSVYL